MRIMSEQGIALLKTFEGFSATPYICPAGVLTIGYGHVIKPSECLTEAPISREEAEIILKQYVKESEQAVTRLVRVELCQEQFDALVSFAYNVGIKAFEKSTLLKKLNAGKPLEAALELEKWVFAGGKRLPGLVNRRKMERILFSGSGDFTKL